MIKLQVTPDSPQDIQAELTVTLAHNDITCMELAETFKAFMLAMGYHPNNVNEAFGVDDEE